MFNALKFIVNRIWDYIPFNRAAQRYQKSLMSTVKNTKKTVKTKLSKGEREVRKRQRNLDRERRQMTATTKKLETELRKQRKESTMRSRLLSNDEKAHLVNRLKTENMTDAQRSEIQNKLKSSKPEASRIKRQLKKQGYKGDKQKMKKLDEQYSDLKRIFKTGLTVKRNRDLADGLIISFTIEPRDTRATITSFMSDAKSEVLKLMNENSSETKFQMILSTKLKKQRLLNNNSDYKDTLTRTKFENLFATSDMNSIYDEMSETITTHFIKKEHEGSGWTLEKIIGLELKFAKVKNRNTDDDDSDDDDISLDDAGASNDNFDIGDYWRNKNAVTVPENKGNAKCGLYAIGIAELKPKKDPGRITKELKGHISRYNTDGIVLDGFVNDEDAEPGVVGKKRKRKFGMTTKDIVKFENQNSGLRIMVLGAMTNKKTYKVLKPSKSPNVILMLFKNPEGKCHWATVRDFTRFVNKSENSKCKDKLLWCTNCLRYSCLSKSKLEFHQQLCLSNETQICSTPSPGNVIKFRNLRNMMTVPVVIYADFECYQKGGAHIPSGYGIYIKSIDDSVYKSRYISRTFDGNVPKEFLEQVISIRNEFDALPDWDMIFTKQDELRYESTKICWICHEPTVEKDDEQKRNKVRDHCHFTGRFRGAAHNECNLNLKRYKFIPVLFHNMTGYDSHLFIKAFSDLDEKPDGIPENTEKFKMLSLKKHKCSEIKFLDSFKFKAKSLDKLVKELTEYPILESEFGENVDTFKRKGIFPY